MNDIQKFVNDSFGEIRTVTINNEPWFVAKDVCDILGIANPTDALNKGLEDFERARFNLGRQGEANIISESGFYTLVLRSRKPIAKLPLSIVSGSKNLTRSVIVNNSHRKRRNAGSVLPFFVLSYAVTYNRFVGFSGAYMQHSVSIWSGIAGSCLY